MPKGLPNLIAEIKCEAKIGKITGAFIGVVVRSVGGAVVAKKK